MNPFGLPPQLVTTLVTSKIVTELAFLAAVGSLSAALVKAIDDLGSIKSWINRNFLMAWFAGRLSGDLIGTEKKERRIYGLRSPKSANASSSRDDAWDQAIELCAAGEERALTQLEVDQICGQLNSAAQFVIQYPQRYRSLFSVLAAGAPDDDIALLLIAQADATPATQAAQSQARVRMANYLQRSVDALHVLLEARWTWWQHLAGFVFSAGIVFVVMNQKGADAGEHGLFVVHLTVATLAGGFLAPVARGIVSALQSIGQ